MFSYEYSISFRNSLFVEQFQWLLINCVLVSERILKKENQEIAFDLISLSHVQIKEPTSRSATTRAFFFLAKYLKQEVDEDPKCLHDPLWPLCNWRYKDLLLSRDQMVMT